MTCPGPHRKWQVWVQSLGLAASKALFPQHPAASLFLPSPSSHLQMCFWQIQKNHPGASQLSQWEME